MHKTLYFFIIIFHFWFCLTSKFWIKCSFYNHWFYLISKLCFVLENEGCLQILKLMSKLGNSLSFPWKDFNACAWIHSWIKMWEGKFRTFEGNWGCTASGTLSFSCPSKRVNFMQGIHVKHSCPSFSVLGRLSEVWITYLNGKMNSLVWWKLTGAAPYRETCIFKREEYVWNKWKLPHYKCTREKKGMGER